MMKRTLPPYQRRDARGARPMKLRCGMTLREVLVMLALGTMLMMLIVMWVARVRPGSRRNLCELRQQEVAAALLQWESVHGHFPGYAHPQATDAEGESQTGSWVFQTLPYLGYGLQPFTRDEVVDYRSAAESPEVARPYEKIYRQYGPDGDDSTRGTPPELRIVTLICPDDAVQADSDSVNPLSWVVNTGMPDALLQVVEDEPTPTTPVDWAANGVFFNQSSKKYFPDELVGVKYLQQHDGVNTTLMLSESVAADRWTGFAEENVGFAWAANFDDAGEPTPLPDVLPVNATMAGEPLEQGRRFRLPSSHHQGGANAVYVGGKTQFISDEIDYLVLTRLMTSHGKAAKFAGKEETVPEPY